MYEKKMFRNVESGVAHDSFLTESKAATEEEKLAAKAKAQKVEAVARELRGGLTDQEALRAAEVVVRMRAAKQSADHFEQVAREHLESVLTAPVTIRGSLAGYNRVVLLGDVEIRADSKDVENSFESAVTHALLARCDRQNLQALDGQEWAMAEGDLYEAKGPFLSLSSVHPELWNAALQRVRRAIGRAQIESVADSVHGDSLGASGMTKGEFQALFDQAFDRATVEHVHEERVDSEEDSSDIGMAIGGRVSRAGLRERPFKR